MYIHCAHGSNTSERALDNRVWHALIVAIATGSNKVTSVEGVTLNERPDCCCCFSEASDKAFTESTATGVELSKLDVYKVLFGGSGLVVCLVLVTCQSVFDSCCIST